VWRYLFICPCRGDLGGGRSQRRLACLAQRVVRRCVLSTPARPFPPCSFVRLSPHVHRPPRITAAPLCTPGTGNRQNPHTHLASSDTSRLVSPDARGDQPAQLDCAAPQPPSIAPYAFPPAALSFRPFSRFLWLPFFRGARWPGLAAGISCIIHPIGSFQITACSACTSYQTSHPFSGMVNPKFPEDRQAWCDS
jgi:hypothetical protein